NRLDESGKSATRITVGCVSREPVLFRDSGSRPYQVGGSAPTEGVKLHRREACSEVLQNCSGPTPREERRWGPLVPHDGQEGSTPTRPPRATWRSPKRKPRDR